MIDLLLTSSFSGRWWRSVPTSTILAASSFGAVLGRGAVVVVSGGVVVVGVVVVAASVVVVETVVVVEGGEEVEGTPTVVVLGDSARLISSARSMGSGPTGTLNHLVFSPRLISYPSNSVYRLDCMGSGPSRGLLLPFTLIYRQVCADIEDGLRNHLGQYVRSPTERSLICEI